LGLRPCGDPARRPDSSLALDVGNPTIPLAETGDLDSNSGLERISLSLADALRFRRPADYPGKPLHLLTRGIGTLRRLEHRVLV
jgi:hypothetical protein